MKNQPSPEYIALCDSFIYHLLSNAPAGVNIKAQRSGEKVNIYILNAPAELYDFSEYKSATRCVLIDGVSHKGNTAYDQIMDHLRAAIHPWYIEHGRQCVEHSIFVGHPRRSFVAMAKNTPAPKKPQTKAAPLAAYVIPAAEQGTRNAEIVAAMWRELAAVLNNMHTTDDEPRRELAKLSDEVRAGIVKYNGDNTPRAYNFEGLAITCAPTALAYIFVKFCKTFKYKPVKMITLLSAEEAAEVAPAPVVEVVEPAPVEVEEVAAPIVEAAPVVAPAPAVEVKAVKRRRVGLGCMVARMVVALLSLLIAVLRLMVAAVRLVERGRLGEVVANGIAAKYKAVRSFLAGRYIALLFAIIRTRAAIRARVEAVRLAIVGRCLAVRSAVVSWWRGLCRAVVGRYMAICLAICARVEAVRLAIVGHIVRLSQAVSVAAAWLLVSARRVEHLANHLENL